ncbi:uncharacterized protein [Elaeis guineensis]|uniref:uncharacterized protein isoform X3 n=1 Tax=Elaeis guineensis var. tenera TaxID=51953 RepID=UPI00057B464D
MLVLRPCKHYLQMPPLLNSSSFLRPIPSFYQGKKVKSRKLVVKGCQGEEKKSQKRSFLSLEEAGLVEISGLSTHERFLCRLTDSSHRGEDTVIVWQACNGYTYNGNFRDIIIESFESNI